MVIPSPDGVVSITPSRGRQMVLPAPIVAEVGYLPGTRAGAEVEANFLVALSEGDFVPVELTTADALAWPS